MALAAVDLRNVLHEICEEYPPAFLEFNLQEQEEQPEERLQNSDEDPYVQKYKLAVGVYHLCAFLGWLEICSQDLVFFESQNNPALSNIQRCLQKFKDDLGNSRLNKADDWEDWKDAFIYLKEQSAIGERMVIFEHSAKSGSDVRVVMRYAQFCESLFRSPYGDPDYWIHIVIRFLFYGGRPSKDFRPERMRMLLNDINELLSVLDSYPLSEEIEFWKNQA